VRCNERTQCSTSTSYHVQHTTEISTGCPHTASVLCLPLLAPCAPMLTALLHSYRSNQRAGDKTFDKCVAALCAQNHPGDSAGESSCSKTASLYSTMSRIGGCREYDQMQAAACDCVDDDRALVRRKMTLEEVYKKVKKLKASDVSGSITQLSLSSLTLMRPTRVNVCFATVNDTLYYYYSSSLCQRHTFIVFTLSTTHFIRLHSVNDTLHSSSLCQ
jgi:hypothetical protein